MIHFSTIIISTKTVYVVRFEIKLSGTFASWFLKREGCIVGCSVFGLFSNPYISAKADPSAKNFFFIKSLRIERCVVERKNRFIFENKIIFDVFSFSTAKR